MGAQPAMMMAPSTKTATACGNPIPSGERPQLLGNLMQARRSSPRVARLLSAVPDFNRFGVNHVLVQGMGGCNGQGAHMFLDYVGRAQLHE
jgi:hypothetical protein